MGTSYDTVAECRVNTVASQFFDLKIKKKGDLKKKHPAKTELPL